MKKVNPLLIPQAHYKTLWNINFKDLAERGYTNLIIDVDNTIALSKSSTLHQEAEKTIKNLLKDIPQFKICLVSNIIFGKKRQARVKNMADCLGVPYVTANFFNQKPNPYSFKKAMEMMNSNPENTAVIGDQIFTDILGGNHLGLFTILVMPLGEDHWINKILGTRRKEKVLLETMGIKLLD